MKEIIKQTLIATSTAAIMMLVKGTPDIVTQLIVFFAAFAVTFTLGSLWFKTRVGKS